MRSSTCKALSICLLILGGLFAVASDVGGQEGEARPARPPSPLPPDRGTVRRVPRQPQEPPPLSEDKPTPEQERRIAELIEQLGAPRLVTRDRAMGELAELGDLALDQVREGTSHSEQEVAWRCVLLVEVIESRQGELFLAARRLNMSITDLAAHVEAANPAALVEILRRNGHTGFVGLWGRILERGLHVAAFYSMAETCLALEGPEGYGDALLAVSRGVESNALSRLLELMVLMPPADAATTIEILTRIGARHPEARARVVRLAAVLRGTWEKPALLAARGGRPEGVQAEQQQEFAHMRALVLCTLLTSIEAGDLGALSVAEPGSVPPDAQGALAQLLGRSGMHGRVLASLNALVRQDSPTADPRAVRLVAEAYAMHAPVEEVFTQLKRCPLPAALTMLDALHVAPRDPVAMQAGLLTLLGGERAELWPAAIRGLSQLRSPGTAGALARHALEHNCPAALRTLTGMMDALDAALLAELRAALAAWPGESIEALVAALAAARDDATDAALLARWRRNLPASELDALWRVAQRRPETPVGGVVGASWIYELVGGGARVESTLVPGQPPLSLGLLRELLRVDDEQGFALLRRIAADASRPGQGEAALALSLTGQDAELAQRWFDDVVTSSPDGARVALALVFSGSDAGRRFRQRTAALPPREQYFDELVLAVLLKRAPDVDTEEVLLAAIEYAGNIQPFLRRLDLPRAVRDRIAAQVIRAERGFQRLTPEDLLWAKRSGVDPVDVLFGTAEAREPRNNQQILNLALLGHPEAVREIIGNVKPRDDGSNQAVLAQARAWLGLDDEGRNRRVLRNAGESSHVRVMDLARRADGGDTNALRSLLDAQLLPDFPGTPGATTLFRYEDQRWRGVRVVADGAAQGFHRPERMVTRGAQPEILQPWFKDPISEPGGAWWAARRGLLEWNAESAAYTIAVLP